MDGNSSHLLSRRQNVKQERRLRMGSKAFDTKRGTIYQFDPNDLVVIGHDTEDGPEHDLYDDRVKLPLDEAMVKNIMVYGVKQTITVRKLANRAEVVDGRRRVLHAREANKRLVDAGEPPITVSAILEHGDGEYLGGVAVSLNEIRLDDDILVKGEKAARMLGRVGNDYERVATMFGVSVTTIKNWTKLGEMSSKVKKAVSSGQLSASAAIQLHGKSNEEQAEKLQELMDGAQKSGKSKATLAAAKEATTGKRTKPGKKVLVRLIDDHADSIDEKIAYGIKLALGMHVPEPDSKLGKLLVDCGYEYQA